MRKSSFTAILHPNAATDASTSARTRQPAATSGQSCLLGISLSKKMCSHFDSCKEGLIKPPKPSKLPATPSSETLSHQVQDIQTRNKCGKTPKTEDKHKKRPKSLRDHTSVLTDSGLTASSHPETGDQPSSSTPSKNAKAARPDFSITLSDIQASISNDSIDHSSDDDLPELHKALGSRKHQRTVSSKGATALGKVECLALDTPECDLSCKLAVRKRGAPSTQGSAPRKKPRLIRQSSASPRSPSSRNETNKFAAHHASIDTKVPSKSSPLFFSSPSDEKFQDEDPQEDSIIDNDTPFHDTDTIGATSVTIKRPQPIHARADRDKPISHDCQGWTEWLEDLMEDIEIIRESTQA
jgi:hypothetical protein